MGTFLSIFVVLVSIVFWKLDQRTSFLIKQSESILETLENNSDSAIGIFINENANLIEENKNRNYFSKILTYGAVFRFTFRVTSFVGNPNLGKDADQNSIRLYKPETLYIKRFQVFLLHIVIYE